MPTTNTIGHFIFTNVGEVTSTFTAPESCATQWKNNPHVIGSQGRVPINIGYVGGCGDDLFPSAWEDCFPNGDKLIDLRSKQFLDAAGYREHQTVPYHSPASACPSDWETVGVAAMSNGTASVTGVFSPTAFDWYPWQTGTPPANDSSYQTPQMNWAANALTTALGPEETAILCCPSGYRAGTNGLCVSTFDKTELAGSSMCFFGPPEAPEPTYTTRDSSVVTWSWGSVTSTSTMNALEVEGTYDASWATVAYTLDSDANAPTEFPGDGSAEFEEFYEFAVQGSRDEDYPFVGLSFHEMLIFIHGGDNNDTDGEEGGDGGDDDSAAVGTFSSVWAVGAAFAMGLIAVAAL